MSKFDINIKEVSKKKYGVRNVSLQTNNKKKEYKYNVLDCSQLVLEFSGADNNIKIINAFKRIVERDLPTYAFPSEKITITENTSVFNNDMIKARISLLPIILTENKIFYMEPKNNKNTNNELNLKVDGEKEINVSINVTNTTKEILSVTTNDIVYYEDGKQITKKYNDICPILLVKLQPNQSFKCSMMSKLGVGEMNSLWASAYAYYDDCNNDNITGDKIENKNNKILFTIHSKNQNDEYDLLIKACKYANVKLDGIKKKLDEKVKRGEIIDTNEMIIVLDGESHTFGSLLTYYLQNDTDVIFCAIKKPSHFIKSVTITLACDTKVKNALTIFNKYIDMAKNLFTFLEGKFESAKKK